MIHTILRSFAVAVAATLVAAAASSEARPGDQSRWSLDFHVRMEQHSASPIEVQIAGDWIETVAAVRNGEYDAQLQLSDLHFNGAAASSTPPSALADLQTRLSRPFWVTCRADGGLLSLHFLRDMKPSDRNLLELIATELQLVRPAQPRTSWTAQERDAAGEYTALYVTPQPGRILKRKLKYTYTDGVAGARSNAVRVFIDRSDLSFSLDASGNISRVDGSNRMHMDLSAKSGDGIETVTEIHAANLRTARAPELIGSLSRALPGVATSAIVTQRPDAAEAQAESDDRLLKGYSTGALLAGALANDAGIAPADRLTALFRRRPESISAAVELLLKNGSHRNVTNALGAAGSPAAVAALAGIARNSALPDSLRVDAIVAFVQTQHPGVDAMRVPAGFMKDPNPAIQTAARMMSGALARAGRSEHPSDAGAIDRSLIALYRNAPDAREKSGLLSALGNSAGPTVVRVIEAALHDERPSIRSAAARALRLAPGAAVDRVLAGVITSDKDASVRADAIFATRFRNPMPVTLADALMHAASSDAADYVRSDAVAVLRMNPSASVRIADTLAHIARLDVDAGVRRQAREALASLSTGPMVRP